MNGYSIALFFHVVGAFGFFVALGLEWTSLQHWRRATTTEQVLEWMRVPAEMGRPGMISMLTLLAAGFYMMARNWAGAGWILVTLGALVLIIFPGMILARRRMAAIRLKAVTEHGPLSRALSELLHDAVLTISIQIRSAVAVGIIFLMTVKPNIGESLLVIVLASVIGFVSARPLARRTTPLAHHQ